MASLALLQVTWDRRQRDFLDHFVPLISEVIRTGEEDVVSLASVQYGLSKSFGLQVPQHAIKLLLTRLCRRQLLRKDHGVYRRDTAKLAQIPFRDLRKEIIAKHDDLVRDLSRFAERDLDVKWSSEEAERALAGYLELNSFNLAVGQSGSPIPHTDGIPDASQFVVAKFVEYLVEAKSTNFNALMAIVQGQMLASALYLPDPSQLNRKFRGTQIFFDTRFLLSALGYHGDNRRIPCRELLDLLQGTGAGLRCFRHTLREMQGALHSAAALIRRGRPGQAHGAALETITYFTESGFPPSEVELRAAALERDLLDIHVEVVDSPSWESSFVIDEAGLAENIQSRIPHLRPEALERDVASVSAVMRLRRGRRSDALETCTAVFVTDNLSVVLASQEFLRDRNADGLAVPACITDYTLTTLLWLKSPTEAPELPMRNLAATCYAATQPDEQLWQMYLKRLEHMERQGKVTPDDYYLARYTYTARTALMDRTLGKMGAFSEGTVTEILDRIRVAIAGEQGLKLQAAQSDVQAFVLREKLRDAHHRGLAHRVAHAGVRTGAIVSAILLFSCIAAPFLTDWDPVKHGFLRWLAVVLAIALAALTFLGIWNGFAIRPALLKAEVLAERRIHALLRLLLEPPPS